MAATSTRNPSGTPKAAPAAGGTAAGGTAAGGTAAGGTAAGGTAAGLTPIWIRLPRIGDDDRGDDESLDGEATARSFSQNRSAPAAGSPESSDSRRDRGSASSRKSKTAALEADDDDELLEEAPAYLREVADRQRSAAIASESEDDSHEDLVAAHAARTNRRGSRPEIRPSASFFTHVFKAPYNVLAGVALVGVFVGLYACFKPGTDSTDAVSDLEPGPSLTLDMGELSSPSQSYVGGPTAVDPSTLYPETSFPANAEFRPTEEFRPVPGIASANYGPSPTMPVDPTTSPAIGSAYPGTTAMKASASYSAGIDPSLAGLPVDTYPETDPATYDYPADANFYIPSGVERTAEGATSAPRAASLGDTLEKTPVR